MSLQLAAQHLASKGRGKDSRLVHMTSGELKGLQALAKAKGGSLTINPETGLPEAGFLDDILPIAATAATMAFFPAAAPALGGMFGASGALATGLGAGLMAGGYNLFGQALAGQPLDLGRALTSGAITGVTAGALQGLGAYNPAAPSTTAAPTSNVMTQTAAAANAPVVPAQAINIATADPGSVIAGMPEAMNTGLASNTVLPANMTFTPPAPEVAKAGMTGGQKLALGLGGVGALSLLGGSSGKKLQPFQPGSAGQIRPYEYAATPTMESPYSSPYYYNAAGLPVTNTQERQYFAPTFTPYPPYNAAQGGLMMANGGPVERMSAMDQGRGMYPQGMIDKTYYATPTQRPASMEVVRSDYDTPVNPITGVGKQFAEGGEVKRMFGGGISGIIARLIGQNQDPALPTYQYNPANQQYTDVTPGMVEPSGILGLLSRMEGNRPYNLPTYSYSPDNQSYQQMAAGGSAGGEYNLGSYSDGGRLLKGPGDGMSDNIPATIGKKQPARLADGEFVVPADVVSHLGNGSTDAGAKRLYAMMDKVRKARTGNKKQGKEIKAEKFIPA